MLYLLGTCVESLNIEINVNLLRDQKCALEKNHDYIPFLTRKTAFTPSEHYHLATRSHYSKAKLKHLTYGSIVIRRHIFFIKTFDHLASRH